MKYIKYIFLLSLFVFSFYISDKLLLYVENLSPIMKKIDEYKIENTTAVNAVIEGNNIIPGKNGKVLNKRESYLKMNDFGAFNETFFVYDFIKPDVSLYDNLDKIIIKGNKDNSVSIILDNNKFYNYFDDNKLYYSVVNYDLDTVNKSTYKTYINTFYDDYNFYSLNSAFKRKSIKERICLVGYSNLEICKNKKYLLVKTSLDIYKNNIIDIINIKSGDIIFLHNDLSLNEVKYILSNIKYNNLKIISLHELVNE